MATKVSHFAAPIHRGLLQLDRELFRVKTMVPALRVRASECSNILKSYHMVTLQQPRFVSVVPPADGALTDRLVLLKPSVRSEQELPEQLQSMLKEGTANMVQHEITLDYDYWSAEDILKSILPEDVVVPTAFETIGHIAHMNLRDEQLPFKHIIGQVLLDKNKKILTVVNKIDTIDTEFRVFKMEVLAGENNTVAQVRESGCTFSFDFSKVYWNSRLHTEHERLVHGFHKGETIVDMMAGVGPFAVPAAKKGCVVYANDLNPDSHAALVENMKRNKAQADCFNLDGREFARSVFHQRYASSPKGKIVDHVVMNLPASALSFLDTFRGLFSTATVPPTTEQLPKVHCYCFSHMIEAPDEDILKRVEDAMGSRPLSYDLHVVRRVAPTKDMFCFTFQLTTDIVTTASSASDDAIAATLVPAVVPASEDDVEPDGKRQKTE